MHACTFFFYFENTENKTVADAITINDKREEAVWGVEALDVGAGGRGMDVVISKNTRMIR